MARREPNPTSNVKHGDNVEPPRGQSMSGAASMGFFPPRTENDALRVGVYSGGALSRRATPATQSRPERFSRC